MMCDIVTKASGINTNWWKPIGMFTFLFHFVSMLRSASTLYTIVLCELCGSCTWGGAVCTNRWVAEAALLLGRSKARAPTMFQKAFQII